MTSNGRHLSFPFRIDPDGRTATPRSDAEHIRDELVQLILTSPGERPFVPEFGGGVRRLIFENTSDTLRSLTQARITQALSRWLGHRLVIENLKVEFRGERVDIEIQYRPAGTTDSRVVKFQRTGQ
jgi:phage baseplate assembly protein W